MGKGRVVDSQRTDVEDCAGVLKSKDSEKHAIVYDGCAEVYERAARPARRRKTTFGHNVGERCVVDRDRPLVFDCAQKTEWLTGIAENQTLQGNSRVASHGEDCR